MITISVLLFFGLAFWFMLQGNKPPAQQHAPVAAAVHAAYAPPAPPVKDTASFVQDSIALLNRFVRIEKRIQARTAKIERLEQENDSLFVELVNVGQ